MMKKNVIEKKLKNGDKKGVYLAFDQYYDKVYGYCYRHVNHRETAQDLTQEVFLRVLLHLENYRHYGKFENYLYVIAGNLCRDYYRKNRLLPVEDMEIKEQEQGFIKAEEQLVIEQALKKLSVQEQEIILLRFYQDLKIKDIARVLGLKLSTVKYHLKRAQEQLKDELKDI